MRGCLHVVHCVQRGGLFFEPHLYAGPRLIRWPGPVGVRAHALRLHSRSAGRARPLILALPFACACCVWAVAETANQCMCVCVCDRNLELGGNTITSIPVGAFSGLVGLRFVCVDGGGSCHVLRLCISGMICDVLRLCIPCMVCCC